MPLFSFSTTLEYTLKSTKNSFYFSSSVLVEINLFSTNVPLRDKPGSWFLPAKCLKNTC